MRVPLAVLLSFYSISAAAKPCAYVKAEEPAGMVEVEKKLPEMPVKIKLDTKAMLILMRACQLGNVPNDLRHLYRSIHSDDESFWEELSMNPDQAVLIGEGAREAAKTVKKTPLPGTTPTPSTGKIASRAAGKILAGTAMLFNSVVGTSCIINIDMWTKGIPHAERVAYINTNFDYLISRWDVEKMPPGESCVPPSMAKPAQYFWNVLRHQLVGASQVLEQILTVSKNEKIDYSKIDMGEDDRAETARVFAQLAERIKRDKEKSDALAKAQLEKMKAEALKMEHTQY